MSVLSDKQILQNMDAGFVVIAPFDRRSLNTSSYDVTLGKFYFRESEPRPGLGIYNPYSEEMVKSVWGEVCEAKPVKSYPDLKLENVSPDDLIIFVRPGETILGHTNEFIGGQDHITTMMKARSSMGRNFIECCKCAGLGDVGYINRWTMEITNNSRFYSLPLVVGRRIAQIVFFETGELAVNGQSDCCVVYFFFTQEKGKDYRHLTGKYQEAGTLEELQKNWNPQAMLPKMYKDREVQEMNAKQ